VSKILGRDATAARPQQPGRNIRRLTEVIAQGSLRSIHVVECSADAVATSGSGSSDPSLSDSAGPPPALQTALSLGGSRSRRGVREGESLLSTQCTTFFNNEKMQVMGKKVRSRRDGKEFAHCRTTSCCFVSFVVRDL